ncbi:MAG: hypothetical protein RIM23_24085 [Coleofasciculus sp. G3-WIS-01]|uniref:nSTAND1 domain-containing NTPase n=1 Tax=Coleofasciculus sp. G3-WIS-01 TaxID=3069528 RepID=UPI0032F483E1
MQELHDALLELPCRHLLTILDCCFAGAFRWASLSRDLEPRVKIYKERYDRFISDRAWQVITSAADDQKALDALARRGKTSDGKHSPFAQALFEALQGTTDENSNLLMRVGDSPLTALAEVLPIPDETTTTLQNLKQNPQALVTLIQRWKTTHPDAKLLLAIDQFEELVTLRQTDSNPEKKSHNRNTEQQQFQKLLKEVIQHCSDSFNVVVTLRLDFEAQFQEGILKEFWENARFVVPPMTQDELREVIEKPASEKVLYFEPPSLVDDLINEVIQMPGGLPLLSFTLSELYLKSVKERRDNRALTDADYKALGKVIGSLTKRADEEYNALVKKDKAYEKTVRQVMLRMVAVGDEARRRVLLSELEYPDHKVNWLVYI